MTEDRIERALDDDYLSRGPSSSKRAAYIRMVDPPPGKRPCVFSSWPKRAETGVGRSNTDIGNKMDLMGHIPGIAMRNNDQRLGEARSTLCKRVYSSSARDPGLARPCERLKSLNVDSS
jgi:hypothetical protein